MRADAITSESISNERAGAASCSGPDSPVLPGVLRRWIASARPGERLVYHRGFLTRDRAAATSLGAPERARVEALAAIALAAAEAGRVHLVQRRLGAFDFVYLAIRAHRPLARPAPASKERSMPAHPIPPHRPPAAEETR